jgi:DNA gyrase/topoisomerase IV subunit B
LRVLQTALHHTISTTGNMAKKPKTNDYTAGQIQVLKGLEAVRKRPGMYIGSTAARGLHHLVYEVVDNAVDEAMAGYCTEIDVILHEDDSVTVSDDGRGIPVDVHPTEGVPGVELAMTTLHAGGKFDRTTYKVSGGLHGVGVSVVNALSEWLEVEVKRDGRVYRQRFAQGIKETDLEDVDKVKKNDSGTTVSFKPDTEIMTETRFAFDTLANRLREMAFLNKGLRIRLVDERAAEEDGEARTEAGSSSSWATSGAHVRRCMPSRSTSRRPGKRRRSSWPSSTTRATTRARSPSSTTSTPTRGALTSRGSKRRSPGRSTTTPARTTS